MHDAVVCLVFIFLKLNLELKFSYVYQLILHVKSSNTFFGTPIIMVEFTAIVVKIFIINLTEIEFTAHQQSMPPTNSD